MISTVQTYTAYATPTNLNSQFGDAQLGRGNEFALKKGGSADEHGHDKQTETAKTAETLGSEGQAQAIKGQAKNAADPVKSSSGNPSLIKEYSEEEEKQISRLKKRDTEVRTHEAAHQSAGGSFAGGATYSYQSGPDGKKYAIGGEVPIDVAVVEGDPEATIKKMDQVIAAALAPADPSGADKQIAAAARSKRSKAQIEVSDSRSTSVAESSQSSEKPNSKTEGVSSKQEDPFGLYSDERNGFFGLVAQSAYSNGAALNNDSQTESQFGQSVNIVG